MDAERGAEYGAEPGAGTIRAGTIRAGKQKTAYEILSGLVGSEMCIRDRMKRTVGPMQRVSIWEPWT